MWVEAANRMHVESGGTLPPNAQPYIDVYMSSEISYNGGFNSIWPAMGASVNNWYMLVGVNGSASTTINRVFGSPNYFLNGSPANWLTAGDVYNELYRTGRNQITMIGGNTSNSGWLGASIGGSFDFGRYGEGGMGMYWFWTADTTSVREEIEEKYNSLCALNIR
jgi:hypothetical protein